MERFIKPFIKYPILGNVIIVALLLFGFLGFRSMKTTFFPPIPNRIINIQASYPGASPEEIEEGIVLKIEDNLKGVSGIERVTSTSLENSCNITVEVDSDYETDVILQDVKNAVNQIGTFPAGMERIQVYSPETRRFAIRYAIMGDVELQKLKNEARRIERDLLDIDGISQISLSGFPEEEIEIALDENSLQTYNLTFDEVVKSVKSENIKITGGKIKGDKEELLIRADSKKYYAEELKNHVLKSSSEGAIVKLKDVARVHDRWEENPNRRYYNNKPSVSIQVENTNEEDLFFITKTVSKYFEKYNKDHATISARLFRDRSKVVQERIDILSENMLIGFALVIIFLGLTLNPSVSFWVAIGIPISFAGMLAIGSMYDLTINVMSLLGMILILGILVDDGIVIGENIYQHHEQGKKPIPAAIAGSLEVFPSVVASVLTTVVIFSAFFFLEGHLGNRAVDLAFVVIATLLISLIEAAFILPSHIAHSKALCKKDKEKNIIEKGSEKTLQYLKSKVYGPALKTAIKHPIIIIATIFSALLITIGALNGNIIQTTFFPSIEGKNVRVAFEMSPGTPVAVTDSILRDIENDIWKVNKSYKNEYEQTLIKSIIRRNGPNTHQGGFSVSLISSEKSEWSNSEIISKMRNRTGKVENARKLNFEPGFRFGKPVSIALQSNNTQQLTNAKEDLKNQLRNINSLRDISDDSPPGLREVKISLKEKAYSLGLNSRQVMEQVRSGFFGGLAQRIIRGTDEVKIYARYSEEARSSIEKLGDMHINTAQGKSIPLEEIANFNITRGVLEINHIDARRVIRVEANPANNTVSIPEVLNDISENIIPVIIEKYPEVDYKFYGEQYESEQTMESMATIAPAILIIMFLIITVTFRSFAQAIVVVLLIPFSIVGVMWGHYIQGYMVSILSYFGIIALIGIVVNDSLVFVNKFNGLLKEGENFKSALYKAGLSRLRPVILTSLTTIAGLGPLVFETSRQAQFLSPMAISVAYGLLFGTFLTLLMLPALLTVLNTLRFKISALLKNNRSREQVEPAVKEEIFVEEQSCSDNGIKVENNK